VPPDAAGSSTAQRIVFSAGITAVALGSRHREIPALNVAHDDVRSVVGSRPTFMRVTVVSALGEALAASALVDLGCAVRERVAVSAPSDIVDGTDAVFVEAGGDGELGAFVVRRVRAAAPKIPLLLGVERSQLSRLDPSWGHDDFITVPYDAHELVARLRAVEWRSSEFAQPERVKVGSLVLDIAAHEARLGPSVISLPNREFDLLVFLARGRGRVVRRSEILSSVWGQRADGGGRSLDVHIRRLREKLGTSVRIETIRGVGYRLDPV
jgi:two-component system response regulator RegX3